ncbi:DUF4365 domain-containing protein [Vibrio splendidus]|uniref:DUF4365 domain-containing protein n=1 Tax=Vibrio splendidus TaxID=29497 RepID=UPI00352E1F7A
MENKLPQQNENQRRGMQAEDILSTVLSKFSFVNRVETNVDIGVDFICEHRINDKPTGKIFNVQCKAIPIAWTKDANEIGFPIKIKTARYWLQLPNLTLLMVVNPENGNVYWVNPIIYLTSRVDNWRDQDEIIINVPASSLFKCFETTPTSLVNCANDSSNHISTALSERLYDVHNTIKEEQLTGITPNSAVVAKPLMDESPLQDAIKTSIALEEFQSNIYETLLARVDKYSSLLYGFIDKWYGKYLRRRGVSTRPLETELKGVIPIDILTESTKVLTELRNNKHERDFEKILKTLDSLEILKSYASDIEAIEYEYEKPALDLIMQRLINSGANIINDNN